MLDVLVLSMLKIADTVIDGCAVTWTSTQVKERQERGRKGERGRGEEGARDTSIIGNIHPNIGNRELVLYIVLGTVVIAGIESKTKKKGRREKKKEE